MRVDITEKFQNFFPSKECLQLIHGEEDLFEIDEGYEIVIGDWTIKILGLGDSTDTDYEAASQGYSVVEILFKNKHHSYWGCPYWYASYSGIDYQVDDISEVEFKEITVKKWTSTESKARIILQNGDFIESDKIKANWKPTKENITELKSIYSNSYVSNPILEQVANGYSILVNNYKIELEEQYGGEGMGEEYWAILKFSKGDIVHSFWKIPGWYASHYGHEFDYENIEQVNKVQKLVDVWE